jgi:hypothetical protein
MRFKLLVQTDILTKTQELWTHFYENGLTQYSK